MHKLFSLFSAYMKLIRQRRKESSMHKNQVRGKKKKNRLTKIDSIIPEISRSRVKSGWQIPSERARANLHVADKTSPRRVGWRKPFKLFASRHWKLSKMTMKGRSVLSVRGRKKKKKRKKRREKILKRNRDEEIETRSSWEEKFEKRVMTAWKRLVTCWDMDLIK